MRGSSSSASGLPWLSVMICSQTAASSGPCTFSSSSARASLSPSPLDRQLGEPGEDVVADARARCAHERDPLGEEAAGDEAEDLRGGVVEPLRVVDDADERLLLGDLGEQRQRGESDQEPVGRRAGAPTEHRRERVALRGGQAVEAIQHRRAELVEAAVGELHLRLDANGRRDVPARDTLGYVVQQRALARTGFAAKDDNSASTGARVGQDPVKYLALSTTSEKPHRAASFGPSLYLLRPPSFLPRMEDQGSNQGSPWCERTVGPRRSFLILQVREAEVTL